MNGPLESANIPNQAARRLPDISPTTCAEPLEFPRFDGHFSFIEGECFSCREQGPRTLRNSGNRLLRWPDQVAAWRALLGSLSRAFGMHCQFEILRPPGGFLKQPHLSHRDAGREVVRSISD